MSDKTERPIESLESWLSAKPYWEQRVWKLNLEKDTLDDEDIDNCYQYLLEHLHLNPPLAERKPEISFKNEVVVVPDTRLEPQMSQIVGIKAFEHVNALPKECSITFGPNLTLVYGGNGAGKSAVGRLLCNACFSRGEREILPNVKEASESAFRAKATFVINRQPNEPAEINYSLGDNHDELKRFSVFDSQSISIHLDQSNSVKFTPGQIKIFDRVAETISKLERALDQEKIQRSKNNPFDSMFVGEDSATAEFCRNITAITEEDDFLKHAHFDPKKDGAKLAELDKTIEEKKKLDVPKMKVQFETDCQNLRALKISLAAVVDQFSIANAEAINKLLAEIQARTKFLEDLSAESFEDGVFQTTGSPEWKALISAAKVLHDSEMATNNNRELDHCVLCHQELSDDARALFHKYWKFLANKAESDLAEFAQSRAKILQDLKTAVATYPKFQDTDAGIKILREENPAYLEQLKIQFTNLASVLTEWISRIEMLQAVARDEIPAIDLTKIDDLISAITAAESKLVDPTDEIAELTVQKTELKHKKEVTQIKDKALEYLAFLKWSARANSAGFPGIKQASTKKRTELFNVGVAINYKDLFNEELRKLGCEFDLVMYTSGSQGNTVKEYKLDFAEDYSPSQILSEGEQNVCALADFLTEAQLDKHNCGIVFDDPVSSLDHERKDKISQRLALEAGQRQVVIFTHDLVFMSQLIKHSDKNKIPFITHWMRKLNGVPGCVEENTSPKLANLASLKIDYQDAIKNHESLGAKDQERQLAAAFDYLRCACEASIEEVLFAGTIRRYDDGIKVQNLEEAVFDQTLALQVVELYGKISEFAYMHNRSDLQRENLPSLLDFNNLKNEFEALEASLKSARKTARKERDSRKDARVAAKVI